MKKDTRQTILSEIKNVKGIIKIFAQHLDHADEALHRAFEEGGGIEYMLRRLESLLKKKGVNP